MAFARVAFDECWVCERGDRACAISMVARPNGRGGTGTWGDRVHRGAVDVENKRAKSICIICITLKSPKGDPWPAPGQRLHLQLSVGVAVAKLSSIIVAEPLLPQKLHERCEAL